MMRNVDKIDKILKSFVIESVEDAFKELKLKNSTDIELYKQAELEKKINQTVGGREGNISQKKEEALPTKQKTENINADAVIDKLNIIRGGKSFSDIDVSDKLKSYIDSLHVDVKTTLFKILQNIASVVATQNVDPERIVKQEDPVRDARLKMLQQKAEKQKNKMDTNTDVDTDIDDNVTLSKPSVKKHAEKLAKNEDDVEDTTPPIKVGESVSHNMKLLMKGKMLNG